MEMKLENLLSLRVARAIPRQVDVSDFVTASEYSAHFQEASNSVDAVVIPESLKDDWIMVPINYFNVYLGEVFTFYITGTNDSTMEAMVDVVIRIDIQIGNKAVLLKELTLDRLEAKASLDALLSHEIKEASTHMLICTLGFTLGAIATGAERQTSRKFFQFAIIVPIDVKTKSYYTERNEIYLETMFTNLTNLPIQLQSVELDSDGFDVDSLNYVIDQDGNDGSSANREKQLIFGHPNRLASGESRQYLFLIQPKEEDRFNAQALSRITSLGKLDIFWISAIGERGHIQTSQLEKSASTYEEIKVLVEGIPDSVSQRRVFRARLRVINCGREVIRPLVQLTNNLTADILWLGSAKRPLVELKPTESATVDVHLYPTTRGVYDFPSLDVTELIHNSKTDFKKLAFVNVN